MIEFKIISCPDKSQQATYQHLGEALTIGREKGDMIIDDPGLGPEQLKVELQGEMATLENLNTSLEIRLNGKPVVGVVAVSEKDNITVARTTINFTKLNGDPLMPPEKYEHPNARDRFQKGSKENSILEALLYLEGKSPESAAVASPPPLPPGAPKPPLPPGASVASGLPGASVASGLPGASVASGLPGASPPKPPLPPGMGAKPPLPPKRP